MTKRDRTGTASTEAKLWAACNIKPPAHVHMPTDAIPFWQEIVDARSPDMWTASDLVSAANLARSRLKIEVLERDVEVEGDVVLNQRGTQIPNPKHALIETLTRRSIALARALHVHAEATAGESRNEKPSAAAQRRKKKLQDEEDDGLMPTLQ